MKRLKLLALLAIALGILALSACSDTPATIQTDWDGEVTNTLTELPPIWEIPPSTDTSTIGQWLTVDELLQLTPLTPGELLATMHTSHGDITLRFFPQQAPVAVENFLTHAWDGFYDGLSFHRVIEDFMIQGGCPQGTGMGGQSIWGGTFGQELDTNLRHFRGALAMAQSSAPQSIGSQFYIVQNTALDPHTRADFVHMLENQNEIFAEFADGSVATIGDVHPEEALRTFLEYGGTPHLDMHFSENPHTVFGHAVSGMDVVDAIVLAGNGEAIINGFSFHLYGGGE